ncbi:NAD(P)H:quinone oxidoreductase [Rariglobus hedericola]|uniref:NAD(P)H dehydrogenase (quinone) n=1 Tax=Rariglobus hedericola TaxID=2597822 RepID=A0A556QGM1_9BACT|nr:NAD(P)H:quinone oxidoreductase [Rariglobus hedericola]TSJ75793.1 NAD(P)H:quinone oxidoreductase [Rariglobus hedericola]
MSTKIKVIFHSLHGHVYKLAEAVAEGARSVPGTEVELLQVQETLSDEVLAKMGATETKKTFEHIPVAKPADLAEADGVLFGSGTRYGSASAQMQAFFDSTGGLWMKGALVGKAGGVFVSTGTQHGGQETTLVSMQTFLFHQGLVVVGVPYAAQELTNMDDITGGSPYGAGTIAGSKGERTPSPNELAIARYQGKHTAQIAAKLATK